MIDKLLKNAFHLIKYDVYFLFGNDVFNLEVKKVHMLVFVKIKRFV